MKEMCGESDADSGFVRTFDRESAWRQFRLSLLLVAAMAMAAIILCFALPVVAHQPAMLVKMEMIG